MEAQRSLLDGILYPHWASGPNFGAGEPRFVFYPPLTWFTGALLGMIFPWHVVSIVLIYLLLAGAGLATRALARQLLADEPATLAGCSSIFLGNMLTDAYMRSDYAELAGGFWIPLLLRLQLRECPPSATPLQHTLAGAAPSALVIAGIWLTNGPLAIMAVYLLAATVLVLAIAQRSWLPIARTALSATLGSTLAGVYLVPAIWERGWANLTAATSQREYIVQNGWLFHRHLDPSWNLYDTTLEIHSWVAVMMFSLAAASVILAWKRGKLRTDRARWAVLALVPFAVLLMQLPVSDLLWRWLPELRLLQFPWRWLIMMNSPLAIFFATAVWVKPRRGRIPILGACALLFFFISGGVWGVCFQDCRNIDAAILSTEQINGIRGKPEYAPPGIRHPLVELGTAANCVVTNLADFSGDQQFDRNPADVGSGGACQGSFSQMRNLPEQKIFMGEASQAGYLILRLRAYPAWRVTVNSRPVATAREETYGFMAVPLHPGPTMVAVEWVTTPDVWMGRLVSLLALALLTALCVFERRQLRPRLS